MMVFKGSVKAIAYTHRNLVRKTDVMNLGFQKFKPPCLIFFIKLLVLKF